MVRIGIIGCGYWGPKHVRNFDEIEGASLEMVSDTRPGRLEFVQSRYKRTRTTQDYREVLASPDVDAVVIATPPATHHKIAMEAIDAGKHLLVEKPMALFYEDAAEIVAAAEKKGVHLMVGHIFLYAPAVQTMRKLVQSGRLGDIYYISSTRTNLGPPNTVVDVLWDLAPHDLSIILDLIQEVPCEVRAHGTSFTKAEYAETVFLSMKFPSGKMAHVHVSWLTPNKTRVLHMVGKDRTVMYDDMQLVEKVRVYEPGEDTRASGHGDDKGVLAYGPGTISIPSLSAHEPLRAECEDFVRAVKTGTPAHASGKWALEVVKILDQAAQQIPSTWRDKKSNAALSGK
jgi:predicted dehydrogenase